MSFGKIVSFINGYALPAEMRFIILFAMLAVLILASCKPVSEPIVIQGTQLPVEKNITPPAPNVTEPAPFEAVVYQPSNDTKAPEPAAEETVFERPVEAPPSIAKYQMIFKKEVKEYKFEYKNDQWFVQGKRAKIIPSRILQNEYKVPFIDTVYIDLENKTATGVCEGRDNNIKMQCLQMGIHKKPYAIPYNQFKIQLPEDWFVELQNLYMSVADSPKLATDRETIHLKHQSQTRIVDAYFDPSFGLPVAVIDNGIEYHYKKLSRNSLGYREKMVPE
jgi:hypothetical protein